MRIIYQGNSKLLLKFRFFSSTLALNSLTQQMDRVEIKWIRLTNVMHFVSSGKRGDRERSSCTNMKTLRGSIKKKYSGILSPTLSRHVKSLLPPCTIVVSCDKFSIPFLLQLSHNPHTHLILLQIILFLCFITPLNLLPPREREEEILLSAEICSWISWGDLRLHKVPVTQQRVSCEAGATDGSTS